MNILQIFPPHLSDVAIIPWEIQESHFQQYYSYIRVLLITQCTQGHYVQTYVKNINTPCLQEVVPSVRCLQRVFMCAKLTLRVSLTASAWRRRRAASANVQT